MASPQALAEPKGDAVLSSSTPPTLLTYAIYDRPKDYPTGFVVREWALTAGKSLPTPLAASTCSTLEAARRLIPVGKVRISRHPLDERSVVEVWV